MLHICDAYIILVHELMIWMHTHSYMYTVTAEATSSAIHRSRTTHWIGWFSPFENQHKYIYDNSNAHIIITIIIIFLYDVYRMISFFFFFCLLARLLSVCCGCCHCICRFLPRRWQNGTFAHWGIIFGPIIILLMLSITFLCNFQEWWRWTQPEKSRTDEKHRRMLTHMWGIFIHFSFSVCHLWFRALAHSTKCKKQF